MPKRHSGILGHSEAEGPFDDSGPSSRQRATFVVDGYLRKMYRYVRKATDPVLFPLICHFTSLMHGLCMQFL